MMFKVLKMKSRTAYIALAIMGTAALSACSSLDDACFLAGAIQVNGEEIAAEIDLCEPEPAQPTPDADPEGAPWM